MCGRFTLRTPLGIIIEQFSLDFQGALFPRYNIAPTQPVPVVRGPDRTVSELVWGLVPFWSKDPKGGSRLINARCETVATKPAFRHAAKSQRCLVAADGYFEWTKQGKRKQPYWIRMQDERPFLMAGLWDGWRDRATPDAERLETFTILTTTANTLTSEIHDRMPVILSPNDYDRWLDTNIQDIEQLAYLFEPHDSEAMRYDPVNPRVNSVRNDDEQCIEILPTLF